MDLLGSGLPDHGDQLAGGRPPDDRVVDQDDPFVLEGGRDGIEFQSDPPITKHLARFDERPADVSVLDQPVGVLDAALGRETLRRRDTRFGNGNDHIGLGYGLNTPEELAVQAEASALTGLIFDPTYTGKAMYALRQEILAGRFGRGDHVIFWHTGGGFAALSYDWSAVLSADGGTGA